MGGAPSWAGGEWRATGWRRTRHTPDGSVRLRSAWSALGHSRAHTDLDGFGGEVFAAEQALDFVGGRQPARPDPHAPSSWAAMVLHPAVSPLSRAERGEVLSQAARTGNETGYNAGRCYL